MCDKLVERRVEFDFGRDVAGTDPEAFLERFVQLSILRLLLLIHLIEARLKLVTDLLVF